jgi:hypothetical protein
MKTLLKSIWKAALAIAPAILFSVAAHAAPSIDLSGVTTVMTSVQTAVLLLGAILTLISLVFAVFSFVGGNLMRGFTGVAGVLLGAGIIGWGPSWIASLSGQSVSG